MRPIPSHILALGGYAGTTRGAYHSHLLLEVIQVPALFGALALLGRDLVIFLVLRGGDTIAVRATRLRARRGYKGDTCSPCGPTFTLLLCALGRAGSGGHSLSGLSAPSCLYPVSLGGCLSECMGLASGAVLSLGLCPRGLCWVCLCFCLSVSVPISVALSPSVTWCLFISVSCSPPPWACPRS